MSWKCKLFGHKQAVTYKYADDVSIDIYFGCERCDHKWLKTIRARTVEGMMFLASMKKASR